MNKTAKKVEILVLGSGFGGISCVLELLKKDIPNVNIKLISNKPHFDYHAGLYRLVSGRSPKEVCIPIKDIFKSKKMEYIQDNINKIDLTKHIVMGDTNREYKYDYLVLALGSDVQYFGIPGVKENAYTLKCIEDGLKLNKHLHEVLESCNPTDLEDKKCASHIVVIGGGASGVELAGELAVYTKKLADRHGLDSGLIKIDLVERSSRVLASMPTQLSKKVEKRLKSLGVNLYLNKEILKEEMNEVFLKGFEIHSKTVIWTAGVCGHRLLREIKGLSLNPAGKVEVTGRLQAQGFDDVYIVGDGANTKYSGMAQTALYDGKFVANQIYASLFTLTPRYYAPKLPVYSIPVGPDWAVYYDGVSIYYGKFGWWLRRYLDLKVMLGILSPFKAFKAFRYGGVVSERCKLCGNGR